MSASPAHVAPQEGLRRDPDNVDVIGRRIVAAFIDIAIMFALFLVLGLTMGESTVRTWEEVATHEAVRETEVSLSPGAFLGYLGLVLLYFFGFEATSGRTLGKRVLGLHVMRLDGAPAQPGAIATRTLLRLVDWLPFLYLVGFICVLATRRHQRLGDLLAKTVVVRQGINRTAKARSPILIRTLLGAGLGVVVGAAIGALFGGSFGAGAVLGVVLGVVVGAVAGRVVGPAGGTMRGAVIGGAIGGVIEGVIGAVLGPGVAILAVVGIAIGAGVGAMIGVEPVVGPVLGGIIGGVLGTVVGIVVWSVIAVLMEAGVGALAWTVIGVVVWGAIGGTVGKILRPRGRELEHEHIHDEVIRAK